MPSAMNGNRTVQSASPDVGSAPGQITLGGGQSSGAQTEAMKQVLGVVDKKVRNMEKKKGKLDDYQSKKNKGERLNQDQLDALTKYQEVTNNLEFARELQKSFLSLGQDIQKAVKKAARREQLQREESEQKRLKTVLELQFLLDRLGEDSVRQELRQGATSVDTPSLLTDTELAALDELYKLVRPEPDQNTRFTDQYEEASQHLMDLLEAKDKAVAGTTYKALKDSLDRVLLSGCFDQAQSHQNGVCEETEEKAVALVEETEEQAVDPEGEIVEEYIEPIEVEATEFVNRQFILDTTYSDKEQGDEWTTETEAVSTILQQPVQSAPPPITTEAQPLNGATPPDTPPADPVVRKQEVQNLLSQMQGPYNFMQDSMLEFDGQPIDPAIVSAQPIDPAIVSAQPMKPPTQNIDLPQMDCPPVHPDSCLSPHTVPVQPEPTQVPVVPATPEVYSTPPPMYHSSHTVESRPQTDSIDTIQVFNLNAPVPPANETEALTQASQYQNSYSQQGFSSQSQQLPVEQTEMQTEQLQSVVGAFHSQDLSLPSQDLSLTSQDLSLPSQDLSLPSQDLSLPSQDLSQGQQLSQQGPGFGPGASRQAQSFYNSRGMTRGGPRNARGLANGYRGYDSYRPPFTNTPNSGYQQAQFNTPRDYSNGGNYQRGEGYNQNYKRGAGQGPRGVSRGGNAQAMKS
ncbi:caprin-1-like isoform X2 [Salvelinus namaycush]|uniref:Caprin-1-like isoform X2 n=1 Tax=Salvelinus namaycush TaxID=8040 RepID=A0A8U1FBZ3_SALNM|nr:caprin-1-like isoform X2 [Salvelinus namaycush]